MQAGDEPARPWSSTHRRRREFAMTGTRATRWLGGSVTQSRTRRRRSAFAITDTELKLMAALAMIGLSRMPENG